MAQPINIVLLAYPDNPVGSIFIKAFLREKIKNLHPVAEALTTKEPVWENDILSQILEELKEIRKNIEK